MEKEFTFINMTDRTIYESSKADESQPEETQPDELPTEHSPFQKEDSRVCVELQNGNRIWVVYGEDWTVRDLIEAVVSSKPYKQFYPTYERIKEDPQILDIFDLKLAMHRNQESESRIAQSTSLKLLKEIDLLKTSKHPFFILVDNRNERYSLGKAELTKIYNKHQTISSEHVYLHALPRLRTKRRINANPVPF